MKSRWFVVWRIRPCRTWRLQDIVLPADEPDMAQTGSASANFAAKPAYPYQGELRREVKLLKSLDNFGGTRLAVFGCECGCPPLSR
jgi:hypothetical protein